jgi:hypothetical protein
MLVLTWLRLDSAHGHSKGVIAALKALKKNFKNLQVMQEMWALQPAPRRWPRQAPMRVKVGIGRVLSVPRELWRDWCSLS